MLVQVIPDHPLRPDVGTRRIRDDAQGDRRVVTPHGDPQGGADAGQHGERGDDRPKPFTRRPRDPTCGGEDQPSRGEIQRSLGDVEARGIEDVRHGQERHADPAEPERLELPIALPREREQRAPQQRAQHAHHEAGIERRRDQGALVGGVIHPQRQREHEEARDIGQRRHTREPDGPGRGAQEHRPDALKSGERVQHDGAGDRVDAPDEHPARDEEPHTTAARPREPEHPRPSDERRRDRRVLLAQKPERPGRGAPADGLTGERGIHREHDEDPR